jgi:hypothetical protein
LLAGGLGVLLDERSADEGCNDATALPSRMSEHIAHEVNSGVVEKRCSD